MNSIFMYDIAENGTATPLSINLSPTEGDGPRNSYSSKDGKLLYVVSHFEDENRKQQQSLTLCIR